MESTSVGNLVKECSLLSLDVEDNGGLDFDIEIENAAGYAEETRNGISGMGQSEEGGLHGAAQSGMDSGKHKESKEYAEWEGMHGDIQEKVNKDLGKGKGVMGSSEYSTAADQIEDMQEDGLQFEDAKALSIDAAMSDHLPLQLFPLKQSVVAQRRKFKFENIWLKDTDCSDIVHNSWRYSTGRTISERIDLCARAVWSWGRKKSTNFNHKIELCKRRMEFLRGRTDQEVQHGAYPKQHQQNYGERAE
nr:uncharacterized protein LOC109149908 [Ipomoea batatas]